MADYATMSDDDLVALEESMYDAEVDGADDWFERDRLLWEMNRRGLMRQKEATHDRRKQTSLPGA